MTGQRLDDLHWGVALGQGRDEGVAQSVKISETSLGLVLDPCGLQVGL
jgi:hypothetical protein